GAVVETLGAIAALQYECPASLRLGEQLLEGVDFPGSDQRRQAAQLGDTALERCRVRVRRLLRGIEALPAGGMPFGFGNGFGHCMSFGHVKSSRGLYRPAGRRLNRRLCHVDERPRKGYSCKGLPVSRPRERRHALKLVWKAVPQIG